MVILIDTNVILDIFLKREPYKTNSELILTKCADRQITGYLAAKNIPSRNGGKLSEICVVFFAFQI